MLKSDGNGGVVISKGLLSMIALMITILGAFASVVAYNVGINSDISRVKDNFMAYTNGHSITHDKIDNNMKEITGCVSDMKSSIVRIDTNIESIQGDIEDIKNGRYK